MGVLSDFVTYDSKYYNIVMNQLGNIIVANNINTAIAISKKINHRYRVISLDGELIHVGGVMSGGSIRNDNSFIKDKYELERLISSIEPLSNNIKELELKIDGYDKDLNIIKDKVYNINIDLIKTKELLNNKNNEKDSFNRSYCSSCFNISIRCFFYQ